MKLELVLALAFGMGLVAGLRTFTAPCVTAWTAHLHRLNLVGSHVAFMGSAWAVSIFTFAALFEFGFDLHPSSPARTTRSSLAGRIATSSLTGACFAVAGGATVWLGTVMGVLGAFAGAFGGYYARARLVQVLRVPDFAIGIPEDLVAVGLGLMLVSRF